MLLDSSTRLALILLVTICFATNLVAEEVDPINAGKTALRDTRPPWYDADADAVRVVSLKQESQADERQDWQGDKPKRPEWKWDWNWDWWSNSNTARTGGGAGNFGFPSFAEVFQFLGWVLLVVLLCGLVYALIRAFLKLEPKEEGIRKGTEETPDENRTDEQRIRDLPIQPTKKKGDFLSMAKTCYEDGQFADAIVYLFSHRLLQLDRAGYIRLTRGKTNRQYLFETDKAPKVRQILGQTILCFEDVFFGKHDLSKERFDATWRDNEAFERIIQRVDK